MPARTPKPAPARVAGQITRIGKPSTDRWINPNLSTQGRHFVPRDTHLPPVGAIRGLSMENDVVMMVFEEFCTGVGIGEAYHTTVGNMVKPWELERGAKR